ncbi:MAG TPA: sugar ABC transporter permease [Ktedonobacteraceae bacterium]
MSSHVTGTTTNPTVIENPVVPGSALRRRSRIETWLFIIPAILFQLLWGWYPLAVAFGISFTDAQPILPSKFTGLQSYVRVWQDPLVAQAFRVTFTYAGLTIALTFLIPIIVAILLMEMPPRVMRWMMLLWFLPLSSIASTILWRYVYDNQIGVFEYIATQVLHLPHQLFLDDPNQVLFWIIFPGILLFGPGLFYMASLQSIPTSYYEAAEVEGAGFWRKIWTISLPRLRPVISVLLTYAIIGSLQEFNGPYILTGGGPEGASRTVVLYLYSYIQNIRYADGTALSIYLFAVILAIVIVFRFLFKEDPDA